jgi:hypothetical protein
LIAQLQSKDYASLAQEWKILTTFIGANDLCGSCHHANLSQRADEFEQGLRNAMFLVEQKIPKGLY